MGMMAIPKTAKVAIFSGVNLVLCMFGHGNNMNLLIYLKEIFLIYLSEIDLASTCAD